jgi:hypothetical protein
MDFYKKLFTISLICIMMAALSTFGMCEEISPPSDAKILDLSKVTPDDLTKLEKSDIAQKGKLIFYAPQDYELPVNLALTGSVISSDGNNNTVKVKFHTSVYVYFPSSGEPLFSIDGNTWEKGNKLFTGCISFGFVMNKNENDSKPVSNLSFGLEVRSEK